MASPVWRRARQLGLERVFGAGPAGFVAASLVGWLTDQVRSRNDVEALDVARLKPGETYLVTTRPPMSRAERRTTAQLESAKGRLASSRRPNRKVRRTAVKLARSQRRADAARDGSRRARKAVARSEALGQRFDRLTAPTAKEAQLQRRVEELETTVAAQRLASIEAARSKVSRRPRTRVFR